MLNQITKETEVKSYASANLTTFTIEIGLHPKDIDRILDILLDELLNRCEKTKKSIDSLNEELEYVTGTLNVRRE